MLDASTDAEIIYKALSTTFYSTDQKALINVIGRRSNEHLQKIRQEYENLYNKDLIKEVESNVSFKFKKLVVGLLKSYDEYRAEEVYKALKGLVTDKNCLIDFVIGNENHYVEEMKHFFRQKHQTSLTEFIKNGVSGDFEKILVKALEAQRPKEVIEDQVDVDVSEIKLCEIRKDSEEKEQKIMAEVLSDILTKRSYLHLQCVSNRYKQKYDRTLKEVIEQETTGWFQSALLACLDTPAAYWAKRVRESLKSLFTDDSLLVHCFSQCNKRFLQEISKEYFNLFEVTLEEDIKKETGGDYGELLATLLDFPEDEKEQYQSYN